MRQVKQPLPFMVGTWARNVVQEVGWEKRRERGSNNEMLNKTK